MWCAVILVRSMWAAGQCGSCGQRRRWVFTAPAGDARREEGAMRGLVWFGLCRTYELLLPLVRDDAAPRRRGVAATGPPGWMGRGSAHGASGRVGRCGQWGCGSVADQLRLGFITFAGGRCAARGESGARLGFVLASAGSTSASSRSCATMRPWGGEALERRGLLDGWGGAVRMRHQDGSGGVGCGAVRGLRGKRRFGLTPAAAGRCAAGGGFGRREAGGVGCGGGGGGGGGGGAGCDI